jgi:hypothetical protein
MWIDDKCFSVLSASVVWFAISTICSIASADVPTCKGELSNTKTNGGTVALTGKKRWQPRGGEFAFVIQCCPN